MSYPVTRRAPKKNGGFSWDRFPISRQAWSCTAFSAATIPEQCNFSA